MIGGSGAGQNPLMDAFPLQQPSERHSVYLRAEGEITPALQGWADVTFGHAEGQATMAQLRAGNQNAAGAASAGPTNTAALTIAATNPYLPAQLLQEMQAQGMGAVDIGKAAYMGGLPSVYSIQRQNTYRLAAGLKGGLGVWTWDAAYFHGGTTSSFLRPNDIIDANFKKAIQAVRGEGANAGRIVCAVNQFATVDPACAPLNIFGVGTASADALNYVMTTGRQRLSIGLDDLSVNLQGAMFDLPAGPVSVALGAEYRAERLNSVVDPLSQAQALIFNSNSLKGRDRVVETYAEVTTPLLKDAPLARELSLNAAYRRAHYKVSSPEAPTGGAAIGPVSSRFDASTWKVGFSYLPNDWVRFRGTVSRDYRAPNISELYVLPTLGIQPILDPVLNTNIQVQTQAGGNPNLRPEVADTRTVGMTFQPGGLLRNLQVTVDYYDIVVKNYIAAISVQTLVNECYQGLASACALVTRGPQDQLSLIKNINANANSLTETGADVDVAYTQSLGRYGALNLRLLATIYAKLEYVNAGSPTDGACQNAVITAQGYPSVPCYQLNAFVTYSKGPFVGALQVRHIPKGKFNTTYLGPQDAGYDPFSSNSINTNRVDPATYLNISGSYALRRTSAQKIELFAAVNNLTNLRPPVSPGNNIGANPILYDVIGRYYKAGVRIAF